LPHYKFDLQLPDIPVKPKLFSFKLDHKKSAEYELSQVEINQEQPLNVDYDMGLGLDLIDRAIYQVDPEMPINKI
jgi:Paf1